MEIQKDLDAAEPEEEHPSVRVIRHRIMSLRPLRRHSENKLHHSEKVLHDEIIQKTSCSKQLFVCVLEFSFHVKAE